MFDMCLPAHKSDLLPPGVKTSIYPRRILFEYSDFPVVQTVPLQTYVISVNLVLAQEKSASNERIVLNT